MIVINYQNIDGVNVPERELTNEEKATIIGTISNGTSFVYYQKTDMAEYLEIMKQYETETN
jgi:hypothetical protein